jgi:hypothetical protein
VLVVVVAATVAAADVVAVIAVEAVAADVEQAVAVEKNNQGNQQSGFTMCLKICTFAALLAKQATYNSSKH